MKKIMVNEIGEDAERRRINEWCQNQSIAETARAELLQILYGTRDLTKGDTHDSQ